MGMITAVVTVLPQCSFCNEVAHYDFRTYNGSWAYGCEKHWRGYRATEGLGLGEGQLLISAKEIRKMHEYIVRKKVEYEEAFISTWTEES
jgi:hypothetical protein